MKKLTVVFMFLLIHILFTGCGITNKSVHAKMIDCFDENVSNRMEALGVNKEQNFEKTFNSLESFLIEQDYIKAVNKNEYQNFIKKVISNPQSFSCIKEYVKDFSIYENHIYFMDASLMLVECSDFILVTEKHEYDSTLNLQNKIIKAIMSSDYSNVELIDELFTATPDGDFEEIVYRVPFAYIIIMNVLSNNTPAGPSMR